MKPKINKLIYIAKEIRKKIIEISYEKKSHHIGSCLSCVEIITILYFSILKLNTKNIKNINKNWFILSKGHAGLSQYIALSMLGFFSEKKLRSEFLTNGGKLGVHPEQGSLPGIDVSSGSLGHGLSIANGLAIAKKNDKLKGNIYVLLSDGECNEGAIWEAAMFASHHKLNNIIAIIDYNKIQALGKNKDILNLEPFGDKFKAFGWSVKIINGHNFSDLEKSFLINNKLKKPTMIIAKTIKGKGIKSMENKLSSHYQIIKTEKEKKFILQSLN